MIIFLEICWVVTMTTDLDNYGDNPHAVWAPFGATTCASENSYIAPKNDKIITIYKW